MSCPRIESCTCHRWWFSWFARAKNPLYQNSWHARACRPQPACSTVATTTCYNKKTVAKDVSGTSYNKKVWRGKRKRKQRRIWAAQAIKKKCGVTKEKKTKTKEKDVSGTTKRERQNTCGHELTSWTFFFLCVLTISQTSTPQGKYNRREFWLVQSLLTVFWLVQFFN